MVADICGLSVNENRTLLDLRLMHQYCIFTTQYFALNFPESVLTAFKVDAPQLAFQHPFLMDTILLVAMVHLGCSDTASMETLPYCTYRDRALAGLRRAVASVDNIDAIRSASVLLATVSFAADRVSGEAGLWVVNWLALASGQRNFRSPKALSRGTPGLYHGNDLQESSLYRYSDDALPLATIPPHIQTAIESERDNMADIDHNVLCKAAEEVGRLINTLKGHIDHSSLERKVKAWAFDVVPSRFLIMAREEKPLALIILAHFLVLFRLLPRSWVHEGLSDHDIKHISEHVGQKWEAAMVVPRLALEVVDESDLIKLLTGCL
jgi:hypothetical protein